MEYYNELDDYIKREIANSDSQYEPTYEEMREILKQSLKAVEETSGHKLDIKKFNEFLDYYKVVKIVEKISEELRTQKYLERVNKKLKNNEKR